MTELPPHPLPPEQIAARVVSFYRASGRELPWRQTADPYAIWISEVMLQQTRVETVLPYYRRWLERFPTVDALAAASLDDVLAAWSGLGYYSRARNLHRGAAEVTDSYGGALPRDAAALRRLPGIGRYTAGAIASLAFGAREPVVDGNVARVLARLYAIEVDVRSGAGGRMLWKLAGELIPVDAPADFNQGIMELGATVCTPRSPRCDDCPLSSGCRAHAAGRQGELPVMPKRTKSTDKPLLDRDALWAGGRGDKLLLGRRPATGLYGGLWELPQTESRADLCAALPGLELEAGDPATVREQELSHRRLRIRVWRGILSRTPRKVLDYTRMRWHPLASITDLGLSSATRAIADALLADERT